TEYADLTSGGPDANETYTNPDNRKADKGNCNSDRRHIFNFTGVVQAPRFSSRMLGSLAGGWTLSGIYRLSSGLPLDVIIGSDRALNGINLQRPNQILANPYGDRSAGPLSQYLNPAAFALPATGTIGNVGFNNVTGPKSWSFDMALSRRFQILERHALEFRVEAYNVTNSFRPSLATTGASAQGLVLTSNTFGQIRNSLDPRIMQFALKYVF